MSSTETRVGDASETGSDISVRPHDDTNDQARLGDEKPCDGPMSPVESKTVETPSTIALCETEVTPSTNINGSSAELKENSAGDDAQENIPLTDNIADDDTPGSGIADKKTPDELENLKHSNEEKGTAAKTKFESEFTSERTKTLNKYSTDTADVAEPTHCDHVSDIITDSENKKYFIDKLDSASRNVFDVFPSTITAKAVTNSDGKLDTSNCSNDRTVDGEAVTGVSNLTEEDTLSSCNTQNPKSGGFHSSFEQFLKDQTKPSDSVRKTDENKQKGTKTVELTTRPMKTNLAKKSKTAAAKIEVSKTRVASETTITESDIIKKAKEKYPDLKELRITLNSNEVNEHDPEVKLTKHVSETSPNAAESCVSQPTSKPTTTSQKAIITDTIGADIGDVEQSSDGAVSLKSDDIAGNDQLHKEQSVHAENLQTSSDKDCHLIDNVSKHSFDNDSAKPLKKRGRRLRQKDQQVEWSSQQQISTEASESTLKGKDENLSHSVLNMTVAIEYTDTSNNNKSAELISPTMSDENADVAPTVSETRTVADSSTEIDINAKTVIDRPDNNSITRNKVVKGKAKSKPHKRKHSSSSKSAKAKKSNEHKSTEGEIVKDTSIVKHVKDTVEVVSKLPAMCESDNDANNIVTVSDNVPDSSSSLSMEGHEAEAENMLKPNCSIPTEHSAVKKYPMRSCKAFSTPSESSRKVGKKLCKEKPIVSEKLKKDSVLKDKSDISKPKKKRRKKVKPWSWGNEKKRYKPKPKVDTALVDTPQNNMPSDPNTDLDQLKLSSADHSSEIAIIERVSSAIPLEENRDHHITTVDIDATHPSVNSDVTSKDCVVSPPKPSTNVAKKRRSGKKGPESSNKKSRLSHADADPAVMKYSDVNPTASANSVSMPEERTSLLLPNVIDTKKDKLESPVVDESTTICGISESHVVTCSESKLGVNKICEKVDKILKSKDGKRSRTKKSERKQKKSCSKSVCNLDSLANTSHGDDLANPSLNKSVSEHGANQDLLSHCVEHRPLDRIRISCNNGAIESRQEQNPNISPDSGVESLAGSPIRNESPNPSILPASLQSHLDVDSSKHLLISNSENDTAFDDKTITFHKQVSHSEHKSLKSNKREVDYCKKLGATDMVKSQRSGSISVVTSSSSVLRVTTESLPLHQLQHESHSSIDPQFDKTKDQVVCSDSPSKKKNRAKFLHLHKTSTLLQKGRLPTDAEKEQRFDDKYSIFGNNGADLSCDINNVLVPEPISTDTNKLLLSDSVKTAKSPVASSGNSSDQTSKSKSTETKTSDNHVKHKQLFMESVITDDLCCEIKCPIKDRICATSNSTKELTSETCAVHLPSEQQMPKEHAKSESRKISKSLCCPTAINTTPQKSNDLKHSEVTSQDSATIVPADQQQKSHDLNHQIPTTQTLHGTCAPILLQKTSPPILLQQTSQVPVPTTDIISDIDSKPAQNTYVQEISRDVPSRSKSSKIKKSRKHRKSKLPKSFDLTENKNVMVPEVSPISEQQLSACKDSTEELITEASIPNLSPIKNDNEAAQEPIPESNIVSPVMPTIPKMVAEGVFVPSNTPVDEGLNLSQPPPKVKKSRVMKFNKKPKVKSIVSKFQTGFKRKPGRPKGSKNKVKHYTKLKDNNISTPAKEETVGMSSDCIAIKVATVAKRGRPKGSKNKVKPKDLQNTDSNMPDLTSESSESLPPMMQWRESREQSGLEQFDKKQKRKPGRPRKNPLPDPNRPKKKRGRIPNHLKNLPVDADKKATENEIQSPLKPCDDFGESEFSKTTEDVCLPDMTDMLQPAVDFHVIPKPLPKIRKPKLQVTIRKNKKGRKQHDMKLYHDTDNADVSDNDLEPDTEHVGSDQTSFLDETFRSYPELEKYKVPPSVMIPHDGFGHTSAEGQAPQSVSSVDSDTSGAGSSLGAKSSLYMFMDRHRRKKSKKKLLYFRSKHKNIIDPVFIREVEYLIKDFPQLSISAPGETFLKVRPGEVPLPSIFRIARINVKKKKKDKLFVFEKAKLLKQKNPYEMLDFSLIGKMKLARRTGLVDDGFLDFLDIDLTGQQNSNLPPKKRHKLFSSLGSDDEESPPKYHEKKKPGRHKKARPPSAASFPFNVEGAERKMGQGRSETLATFASVAAMSAQTDHDVDGQPAPHLEKEAPISAESQTVLRAKSPTCNAVTAHSRHKTAAECGVDSVDIEKADTAHSRHDTAAECGVDALNSAVKPVSPMHKKIETGSPKKVSALTTDKSLDIDEKSIDQESHDQISDDQTTIGGFSCDSCSELQSNIVPSTSSVMSPDAQTIHGLDKLSAKKSVKKLKRKFKRHKGFSRLKKSKHKTVPRAADYVALEGTSNNETGSLECNNDDLAHQPMLYDVPGSHSGSYEGSTEMTGVQEYSRGADVRATVRSVCSESEPLPPLHLDWHLEDTDTEGEERPIKKRKKCKKRTDKSRSTSDASQESDASIVKKQSGTVFQKKKFQKAGLYSDSYKDDKMKEKDTSLLFLQFDLPLHFGNHMLKQPTDFQLPYDVWWLHFNDMLPKKGDGQQYRRIRNNLYVDARPVCRYEAHSCVCKLPTSCTEKGCGEDCLNRTLYTECSPDLCPCGDQCSNQNIQKHNFAPGLQKFLTIERGFGVKSIKKIAEGELIIEYLGEVVSEQEFRRRMTDEYSQECHHYCLNLDSGTVIDGYRMGNLARFVNHSCKPNCEMQKWNVNGMFHMCLFAVTDIESGTEIVYDYNFHSFNQEAQQLCKCGNDNCRGIIGGKRQNNNNGQGRDKTPQGRLKGRPASDKRKSKHRIDKFKETMKQKRLQNQGLGLAHGSSATPGPQQYPRFMPSRKEKNFARDHAIFLVRNIELIRNGKKAEVGEKDGDDSYIKGTSYSKKDVFITQLKALNSVRSMKTRRLTVAEEDSELNKMARLAQILKDIYSTVASCKDEDGNTMATDLFHLPSRKKHPWYYEVIKYPVDLKMIERKIYSAQYQNIDGFEKDVLQLFQNVETYCGKKSAMGQRIKHLRLIYAAAKQDGMEHLYDLMGSEVGQGSVVSQESEVKPEGVGEIIAAGTTRDEGMDVGVATPSVAGSESDVSEMSENKESVQGEEDEEEEIIRCICGIFKDEGLMIQCEKCFIWQHTDCMQVNGDEENYLCEECNPRPVDKEVPLSPNPDEDDVRDDMHYYMTLMRDDMQIRLGSCVYVIKENLSRRHSYNKSGELRRERMDIFRIERLWKNDKGQKFAFGFMYVRPRETFHEPTRKFYPNEVFRTPLYEVIPLDAITGYCCVLDPLTYCKGRPKGYRDDDLYICEFRMDKTRHLFYKISAKQRVAVNTKSYCFEMYDQRLAPKRNYSPHEVPEHYQKRGHRDKSAGRDEKDGSPNKRKSCDGDDDPPLAKVLENRRKSKRLRVNKLLDKLSAGVISPSKKKVDLSYLLVGCAT